MVFIGVDFYMNFFMICCLMGDGLEVFEIFMLLVSVLQVFCFSLDVDDEIVVEVMGNMVWFCDEICVCVGCIVVVNLCQFQVICKLVNKMDKNDVCVMVFFLFKDMLFEIWLKLIVEVEFSLLIVICDVFVKICIMLFNKIYVMFV